MKIAYIVPGTGESFYCGNCLRDSSFIKALKKSGHDITTIPMYLPLTLHQETNDTTSPIFYGAVNLYLKQLNPVFKKMPKWGTKLLNSDTVLKFAAKRAGSTRAAGLEEMTLSMLRGENGNQSDDLDILIKWLREHHVPDVIHLSNALLLGMAPKLKKELNATIICSLQDEDEWLDEMREPYQSQAWQLMNENSKFVDAFVSVSHYFKKLIQPKINIPDDKIYVVYNGVDSGFYKPSSTAKTNHVIGYMSRISEAYGLDILIDSFIILKNEQQFDTLKLKISGGFTGDDKKYVKKIQKKIEKELLNSYIEFVSDFSETTKPDFYKSLSIFCVPAIRKEAIGMHLLEALVSGVPVVQPDYGAYSEIVNLTKAGLLYSPNTPEQLAVSLKKILTDKSLYTDLQKKCISGIETHFNSQHQVKELIEIYSKYTDKKINP